MNKRLNDQMEEATARIEVVLHIGGMVTGDSLPEALDDLLHEDDQALESCFPDMPEWVKSALDTHGERQTAFADWVLDIGRLGFVVKFATPVMRNVDEDGCGTYSWSAYYTHWVYGETLEDAAQAGLAWVAQRRADELETQRRKSAAT